MTRQQRHRFFLGTLITVAIGIVWLVLGDTRPAVIGLALSVGLFLLVLFMDRRRPV